MRSATHPGNPTAYSSLSVTEVCGRYCPLGSGATLYYTVTSVTCCHGVLPALSELIAPGARPDDDSEIKGLTARDNKRRKAQRASRE